MAIIYIPLNPAREILVEVQKVTLEKFLDEGWKHDGTVKLKDMFGTEIEVAVLRKEIFKKEE